MRHNIHDKIFINIFKLGFKIIKFIFTKVKTETSTLRRKLSRTLHLRSKSGSRIKIYKTMLGVVTLI
jgi:hypothetical protein